MSRFWFFSFLVVANILSFNDSASAQECTRIQLSGEAVTLEGFTPFTDWECYSFRVSSDSVVDISLESESGLLTVLTESDFIVGEATEAEFRAYPSQAYEIRVGPPYRMSSSKYLLTLKVRQGDLTNWKFSSRAGEVRTQAKSVSGSSELEGACTEFPSRGYHFNLVHGGNNLTKIDDETENVKVLMEGKAVGNRTYDLPFHYFAPDLTYVLSKPVSSGFLNSLAAAETMTFKNQSDEVVAVFDLSGTSKLRKEIRSLCGF